VRGVGFLWRLELNDGNGGDCKPGCCPSCEWLFGGMLLCRACGLVRWILRLLLVCGFRCLVDDMYMPLSVGAPVVEWTNISVSGARGEVFYL